MKPDFGGEVLFMAMGFAFLSLFDGIYRPQIQTGRRRKTVPVRSKQLQTRVWLTPHVFLLKSPCLEHHFVGNLHTVDSTFLDRMT